MEHTRHQAFWHPDDSSARCFRDRIAMLRQMELEQQMQLEQPISRAERQAIETILQGLRAQIEALSWALSVLARTDESQRLAHRLVDEARERARTPE